MKISAQNIRKLEKALLRSLVDPQDSEIRKRYVKGRIYGEASEIKENFLPTAELEPKSKIMTFLQRLLIGIEE